LAAMLWLYGVAWHQPMAESIAWARTTIAEAIPSASTLTGGFGGGRISGLPPPPVAAVPPPAPVSTAPATVRASTPITTLPASAGPGVATIRPPDPNAPLDTDVAAMFAERKAKVAVLSAEGPRMLKAGNWRRAAELCKAWTELELANAESYRCLGQALQAQGYHQDAIAAFRKAKQYDPGDRTLDAAIDRSQKGIVADFLNRYRR
ncbi:MAG: tetratricopeptide repeat protein, partial [Casimicrobiaceae bacterium]